MELKPPDHDDINGFAVFYNPFGNCVSQGLRSARSVSWGSDCLWGHFGTSRASPMCREGSGAGSVPVKQQLLPAELASITQLFPVGFFYPQTFHQDGKYVVSSGLTWSGCFCCQLAWWSEHRFFTGRYTRLNLAFGDIHIASRPESFCSRPDAHVVFDVKHDVRDHTGNI